MWLIACATVRETSGWINFSHIFKYYIKIWTSILRTTQDWHTSASNIRQNIVESCVILKNLISYFEKFLKFNCLYANSENVTHFSTIFCDIFETNFQFWGKIGNLKTNATCVKGTQGDLTPNFSTFSNPILNLNIGFKYSATYIVESCTNLGFCHQAPIL